MVSLRGRLNASARNQRFVLAFVPLLLVYAGIAPLWGTRLESPQYHGEEALQVSVYAGQLAGDLREIRTLNQYIGVHIPTDIPELKLSRPVIAGFIFLSLLVFFLPARYRRGGAAVLFVLILIFMTTALGCLQYRLYEMGHVRSKGILTSVKDFTPMVFGTQKIGNFTVSSYPQSGGIALLGAMLLTGLATFFRKRKPVEEAAGKQSNIRVEQFPIQERGRIEWQSNTKR